MAESVTDKRTGATFTVGDKVVAFGKRAAEVVAVSMKGRVCLTGDFNGWTATGNVKAAA